MQGQMRLALNPPFRFQRRGETAARRSRRADSSCSYPALDLTFTALESWWLAPGPTPQRFQGGSERSGTPLSLLPSGFRRFGTKLGRQVVHGPPAPRYGDSVGTNVQSPRLNRHSGHAEVRAGRNYQSGRATPPGASNEACKTHFRSLLQALLLRREGRV